MAAIRSIARQKRQEVERAERIKIRKQLNADALISDVRNGFASIEDHRAANVKHKLPDALTAGFAMFSLKFDSLLEFDKSRKWSSRYMEIYGLYQIPCDSSLRNILDGVDPVDLRPIFTTLFRRLQRGKSLEKYKFLDEYYLVSPDGTEFFPQKNFPHRSVWRKRIRIPAKRHIIFRCWEQPSCIPTTKRSSHCARK